MRGARFFLLSVLVGSSACASRSALPPVGPEGSVIGISVELRAPIKIFTAHAEMVYFVKLSEGADPYLGGQLRPSNYRSGSQVYLLNAAPGRYAVVAAFERKSTYRGGSTTYTTFFSDELRQSTEVDVAPGTIVFMGNLVVNMSVGVDRGDASQIHFAQLIAPGIADRGWLGGALSGENVYHGKLQEIHRDAAAEASFLAKAREHLGQAGWTQAIQRRLEQLQ